MNKEICHASNVADAKFWEAGSASKFKSQIRICIYIKVKNREL